MGVDKVTQGVGDPLTRLKEFIPKSLLHLTATARGQGEAHLLPSWLCSKAGSFQIILFLILPSPILEGKELKRIMSMQISERKVLR